MLFVAAPEYGWAHHDQRPLHVLGGELNVSIRYVRNALLTVCTATFLWRANLPYTHRSICSYCQARKGCKKAPFDTPRTKCSALRVNGGGVIMCIPILLSCKSTCLHDAGHCLVDCYVSYNPGSHRAAAGNARDVWVAL